jgi:hypothetical protein
MYGHFDLEVVSNLSKNERRPSNFHEILAMKRPQKTQKKTFHV